MTIENEQTEVTETPVETPVEAAETPAEESKQAEPVEEPAKPNPLLKRIDKLTAQRHQLEDRIRELEEKASKPVTEEKEDTDIDSIVAKKLEQVLSEREQKKASEDRLNGLRTAYIERETKYAEAHPEYFEDVENATVTLPKDIAQEVLLSEDSAELTHYFAKNPEVAKKMGQMTVIGRATEFIRIQDRIKNQETSVKKTSQTPAPIPDSNGFVSTSKKLEDMSMEEFVKIRNSQT